MFIHASEYARGKKKKPFGTSSERQMRRGVGKTAGAARRACVYRVFTVPRAARKSFLRTQGCPDAKTCLKKRFLQSVSVCVMYTVTGNLSSHDNWEIRMSSYIVRLVTDAECLRGGWRTALAHRFPLIFMYPLFSVKSISGVISSRAELTAFVRIAFRPLPFGFGTFAAKLTRTTIFPAPRPLVAQT